MAAATNPSDDGQSALAETPAEAGVTGNRSPQAGQAAGAGGCIMYFDNITTMDGLRAEYRRLIKINHPDAGGDEAVMKAINLAYEAAVDHIRRHGEKAEADKAAAEVPAEFMAAVSAVVACPGLIVEIVGSWVWVTGNTYANRERLKSAGYRWSSKKSAWYWHPADQAVGRPSHLSLDQIRDKYGSQRVGASCAPHALTA